MSIIYLDCDPVAFGTDKYPVTILKKKIYIRPKSKPYKAMTFGDEVDSLVKEWYALRGLPVPPEDLVGSAIDAAQAAEDARLEAAAAVAAETIPDVAPPFGTPEFWAYHRLKKAAENKRREEEGLPPLPTKKELEAEKAKKAAERANKIAERLAKMTLKDAQAKGKA